ncbi:MAG TPA: hemerythrin domain-containing protein [Acidobacteriota bacterium]|nr:hemerythrin domain-containing protein [Acidobacteriota bacterium]
MTESIFEFFERDHDRLDELFLGFQKHKRSNFPKAREYFAAFKFGLQRHIVWEEDVLFPLYDNTVRMEYGPTFVMRLEHKEIAQKLEALHKKIQSGDVNSDREEQDLKDTLRLHNDKEENILYPTIDRTFTTEEKRSLFEALLKIPEERYAESFRTVEEQTLKKLLHT